MLRIYPPLLFRLFVISFVLFSRIIRIKFYFDSQYILIVLTCGNAKVRPPNFPTLRTLVLPITLAPLMPSYSMPLFFFSALFTPRIYLFLQRYFAFCFSPHYYRSFQHNTRFQYYSLFFPIFFPIFFLLVPLSLFILRYLYFVTYTLLFILCYLNFTLLL